MKKRVVSFWLITLVAVFAWTAPAALAQQGVPLNSAKIPQFVDPLPLLSAQTGSIETLDGTASQVIYMREFQANVMPSTFVPAVGNYTGTWVWGYRSADPPTPADTYIGPVIVAERGTPTQVTWVNNLGDTATTNVAFWPASIDQTLHWADPLGLGMFMGVCPNVPALPGDPAQCFNYQGPIPAVTHLHGGEVPPVLDGGPDSWFLSSTTTPTGYNQAGHAYYTRNPLDAINSAVYNYPNSQEAANIWFHDHVLGATRLNVYAGLAGAYIITDPVNAPPPDLGDPTKIIPLVIQDRMFDTNGQLYIPNIGINPEHPFWVPEFVGDTIVVNGKVWPFLEIGPNRYRFLVLNGSNARAYTMDFKVQGKGKSPTFWVIGTDGGYLDAPVAVAQLTVMPGERYDVIVDFAGFKAGTTLTLQNSARTPYPGGAPVQRSTTGRIMQFRVVNTFTGIVPPTITFDPATAAGTHPLRPYNQIVRLTTALPVVKRQLTLNEVIGAGGPLEILVNNTKWSGLSLGTSVRPDFKPVEVSGVTEYYSELPNEGDTELWEIINMTADAHPIHLHLVQFQLMNRQAFNLNTYTPVYDAAFPIGVYVPAYGPPNTYTVANADGAVGGNPAVTPFLLGAQVAPLPQEQGWKDTVIMYPGEVTRIMVRWAPTDIPIGGTGGDPMTLHFTFDPNALDHGYVWHCHIIDHEDNEMMRPTQVQPMAGAVRTFVLGTDY